MKKNNDALIYPIVYETNNRPVWRSTSAFLESKYLSHCPLFQNLLILLNLLKFMFLKTSNSTNSDLTADLIDMPKQDDIVQIQKK